MFMDKVITKREMSMKMIEGIIFEVIGAYWEFVPMMNNGYLWPVEDRRSYPGKYLGFYMGIGFLVIAVASLIVAKCSKVLKYMDINHLDIITKDEYRNIHAFDFLNK